jgi:rhamnulokinase
LKNGLKKAAARQLPIASISTDSWGVDYVLYDERGLVMPPVWCYRDSRTAYGVENARDKVDWPTIYAETGIQFMATQHDLPARRRTARTPRDAQNNLLLIGDAFNYFCSGVARNEVSRQHDATLQSANADVVEESFSTRSSCARKCSRRSARAARGSAR